MVELKGIKKYFPSNGVMALQNAAFTLRPGEIHALLGENGTGKSTLMHIMAGFFPPSSGVILIDGKERHFSAPSRAHAAGIGMVRQHPAFVPGFKVWEDCILGAEKQGNSKLRFGKLFFDPGASKKRVEELSGKWRFDLPLDNKTESLTVSQRQKAAVLALLLRDVKWLIFDEPTAVLTAEESRSLTRLFENLRGEGRGIVLITHKLEEALAVSDRITVISRGVTGEARDTKGLSLQDLEREIFRGAGNGEWRKAREAVNLASFGEVPILEIKDLSIFLPGMPPLKNINLNLMPGKVVGITGVRDAGLETLELAVTGLLRCPGKGGSFSGSISLNGRDIAGKGIRAFRAAGGAWLGADRLGENLAPGLPIRESLVIHAYRRERRGIFLDLDSLDSKCMEIMSRAGIERSIADKAASFSGGMLQRILLAREFSETSSPGNISLVVLAEPGSGLDAANKSILDRELADLRGHGKAALLFSTDADELASLADEIFMLRNGELIPFREER